MRILLVMLVCFVARIICNDVAACTVGANYLRPTNFELVYQTPVIVLAEAVSFRREGSYGSADDRYDYGKFTFKILDRIKGEFPAGTLVDDGDTLNLSWGPPEQFDYQKGDTGPCNAHNYKVGRKYVLFLEQWKNRWLVTGPAFSRINVEVTDGNAPWVEAVRRYTEIGREPDYTTRKAVLKKLRERASKNEPGCPKSLVSDIDAHFEKASNYKSGEDLLELYKHAFDDTAKELALWAFANRKEPLAKPLILSMLNSGEWKQHAGPVCSYVREVRVAGAFSVLADALAKEKNEWSRRYILSALPYLTEEGDSTPMLRVLKSSINGDEARILGWWFIQHPSTEALELYRGFAKGGYTDAWEISFILAAMSDHEVVDWAKKNLTKLGEKRWVCGYILARSPLAEADEQVEKILRGGDTDELISIVQGYEDSKAPRRVERLREIAGRKHKSRKLIFWLRRTLSSLEEKGDKDAAKVLATLPVVDSEHE